MQKESYILSKAKWRGEGGRDRQTGREEKGDHEEEGGRGEERGGGRKEWARERVTHAKPLEESDVADRLE